MGSKLAPTGPRLGARSTTPPRQIDELPPKGTRTELQEETRKVYEDLKKGYDDELKNATEALDRLQGVCRAYDEGRHRVGDALAMLDRRDSEFCGLSPASSSTRRPSPSTPRP